MGVVRGTIFGSGMKNGVAAVLIALLLAGCGYHMEGARGTFAPGVKTVFVDVFKNNTSEVNADSIFRTAFNDEIVQNGHFKITSGPEQADAVFRGTILSVQSSTLAYQTSNLSAENRLTVTLRLSFEERASGKVLWELETYTATGDYRVASVGVTASRRREALTKLADDAAERIYRLMMSDF